MPDEYQKLAYEQLSEYIKSIPKIVISVESLNKTCVDTNAKIGEISFSIANIDESLKEHQLDDIKIQTEIKIRLDNMEKDAIRGRSLRPQYYDVIVAIVGVIISLVTALVTTVVPILGKKP